MTNKNLDKIKNLLNSHEEDPETLPPLVEYYEAIMDSMGGYKEFARKFVQVLDGLPNGSSQQVNMYNTILSGMQMLADRNVIQMTDSGDPVAMTDEELEAYIGGICEAVIEKDD